MTTKTQNEKGEWVKAKPLPYYPTLIDKIRCFLGKHIWFYRQVGMLRSIYCIACNKEIFPVGEDK